MRLKLALWLQLTGIAMFVAASAFISGVLALAIGAVAVFVVGHFLEGE